MKLNVSPIADTKEYTDPWGLGVTYTVRRTGHPKAVDKEVVTFEEKMERARGISTAAAMERAKADGRSTGIVSMVINDTEYSQDQEKIAKEMEEKESYMQERKASALLAGWKGKVFKEKHLPKDGALDAALARKAFFESLTDDDLRIPRFKRIGEDFVSYGTDEYDTLCEFVLSSDEAMLDEKDKVSSDDDSVKALKLKAEVAKDHTKRYLEGLKEKGFEEVPCYGEPLRVAWALHIISNAEEVETAFNRARGILQRTT